MTIRHQSRSGARHRTLAPSLALVATLGLPAAALADDDADVDLGTVVVSANRTPTDIAKVGSAVTVVTRDELERSGETLVKDYLQRIPGLGFSQAGGPGQTMTMEMRGLGARYVLVRIDGIDVSDPTQPQVAPALEHLLTGDVERIEILRGSQSALYGGTAVAGVIDITTKTSSEKGLHHSLNVEGGSYGTYSGRYGASWSNDVTEVNASIQRLHTDGFSSADRRNGNTETDGYDNTTASFNASHRINDILRVFGAMRYTHWETNYDDFYYDYVTYNGWPADETGARFHTSGEQISGRVGADLDLLDGRWKNTFAVQASRITRDIWDSYPGHYDGRRQKFEYLGSYRLNDWIGFSFGADHTRESAESSDALDGSIHNTGVFGQIAFEPVKGVNLTAALRDDYHSMFGNHVTGRLTAAWEVMEGTKLRTSWGTGFRPPSVYELYAPFYGNPNLDPEKSRSLDAGIDQRFWDGRASVSATWFHISTDNLIDYDTATWAYTQIEGTSTRQGVELSGRVQALDWLGFDAAYTYTDARKPDHSRLERVPRHKVALGTTVKPWEKTSLSLRGTYVLDSVDVDYAVGGVARELPAYFLLDATVSHQLTDKVEVYVKGRNLLDQKYETVWGYGTPGASVYAGLTVRY